MHLVNKSIGILIVLCVTVLQIKCVESGRGNINFKGSNKQDERDRSRTPKQHEDLFPYKLENAPIPSMHDGPQVLRLGIRSIKEGSRIKRHISQANGLNPQKPKDEVVNEGISSGQTDNNFGEPKHFHHPGHSSQLSKSQPINNYNYYKILNTYGSGFQYGNGQPFNGYFQTPNIGVVPPKGTNAREYYNSISNINQYPTIGQHSLYENKKYQTYGYGYGYGDRDYVKNAYMNVLTGLAMWGIMNGLANGKRYTIYNYKNLPQSYPKNVTITNETITTCIEDATALCNDHSQPLCINDGTTFCVTSAIVSCPGETSQFGYTCVNTSVNCDNCENKQSIYLPCAANVTVSDKIVDLQKFNQSSSNTENMTLCATSLVVPQTKTPNQALCDNPPCLANGAETLLNSIIESTTNGIKIGK